jgi:hypothetical protein
MTSAGSSGAKHPAPSVAAAPALHGLPLSVRPDLWQPYATAKRDILQAAKPVATLKTRFPLQASAVTAAISQTGRSPDALLYLPMVGRKSFWTVLLDPATADIVAFMPLDSF